MYLRCNRRVKDGKEHCYWNIVESKRCAGGRVVQRQVLYLGEINDSQRQAWCRVIEAFDEDTQSHRQLALFPASREVPEYARGYGIQVRLEEMALHRPRQWGACWLACHLYRELGLEEFWAGRLADSREGTRWRHILQTLVCYRLIDPGSEWRLHRQWYEQSATATFTFGLNRKKLRQVRRREGRYLLRTNLCGRDPAELWQFYTNRWRPASLRAPCSTSSRPSRCSMSTSRPKMDAR